MLGDGGCPLFGDLFALLHSSSQLIPLLHNREADAARYVTV